MNNQVRFRVVIRWSVMVAWITASCFPEEVFPAPSSVFTFDRPSEPTLDTQVIGKDTTAADRRNWPVTFVFKNLDGGGCTATGIGDQAVLTAAHCLPDGASGKIKAPSDKWLTVTCSHHPNYPEDISADFALCSVDSTMGLNDYEVINSDLSNPGKGASVTLLGYGCRTEGGSDKTFGLLFQGDSKVAATSANDNYIRTSGGAAVCFGDSGGGAYSYADSAKIKRRLIGVNSRGDISANSWIAVTASKLFRDWAKKWSDEKKIAICGVTESASNCRQ